MAFSTLCLFLTQAVLFASTLLFLFRKGEHTLAWFFTTLPFAVNLVLLFAFYLGSLPPLVDVNAPGYAYVVGAASFLCASSIGLFWFAAGSHRVTVPMFHQDDSPAEIVTWGAYRFVRHPFYTSYIIYFIGCIMGASPLLALNGEVYGRYLDETGRFWPPLRAVWRELSPPPPGVVQEVYRAADVAETRRRAV